MKYSGRCTVGCTGVGTKTSETRLPDRYAVCTSEDIKEAVSIPDVKKERGASSEECVSEDGS